MLGRMWSPPSTQMMGEGERTEADALCTPALSLLQTGCFLLQLEFCVVNPWSDSHGLCDWSCGLLGPQLSV